MLSMDYAIYMKKQFRRSFLPLLLKRSFFTYTANWDSHNNYDRKFRTLED